MISKILQRFRRHYKSPKTALRYRSNFQLLVSTILSAQCTDKRVNAVTKELFKKYKTPKDFSKLNIRTLEKEIYSTGFYKNKAKNIKATSKLLIEKFHSRVPSNMKDLLTLPGVARKTANVVLSSAFGKNEGIVVDTHVKRVSYRLGLTKNKDPKKIEQDLMKIVSKRSWRNISFYLINHGRTLCMARNKKCKQCFLNDLCPSAEI